MSIAPVQSFAHGRIHALELADTLGAAFGEIGVHKFPDGESRVTVAAPAPTTILYCPLDRPNGKLVELALAAEALRRGGAARLVLVAPYLCYMRQDKVFHEGEAISQKAIGGWLGSLFDRIVTVDAHLHRVSDIREVFPGTEAQNLTAAEIIAEFARERGFSCSALVAGPDAESIQWVSRIAGILGAEAIAGEKDRRGDRDVRIVFPSAKIEGRSVLVADDIVSSGGTVTVAVESLKRLGAADIAVVVTHALFDAEIEERIRAAGARAIWSTTSVPHPTNAISLTGILTDAVRSETGSEKQK
ncbi:MAG: ribose-phosphate diphosphokinase [Parvibaculum sp.]|uniref:ribose-phosphate diphosphokinase n=1 Tax=Parvibaculum sp. TaxID=2024848 RepID=UPI0034A0387D